jgi:hypothetical protein
MALITCFVCGFETEDFLVLDDGSIVCDECVVMNMFIKTCSRKGKQVKRFKECDSDS